MKLFMRFVFAFFLLKTTFADDDMVEFVGPTHTTTTKHHGHTEATTIETTEHHDHLHPDATTIVDTTITTDLPQTTTLVITEGTTTEEMITSSSPLVATTTDVIKTTTMDIPASTTISQFDYLQQQIDSLNAQVSSLSNEVDQNEIAANATIDALYGEINDLESEVAELEVKYDSIVDALEGKSAQRTCQDYYDVGLVSSDYYYVDPDGEGGMEAFLVYCDMETLPGYGITQFSHDSENRTLVNGCEDPGCYTRDVTYNLTINQIRSVLALSQSCRQYIKYECLNSMMFYYNLNTWWRSHDNMAQYYWGGADPDSLMCGCGKEGSCDLGSTSCSCDLNDEVWREDDGYLTDVTTLPVTQLAFGDTEGLQERGYHTLGKLECYGQGGQLSCNDLKNAGKPTGTYTINPDPSNQEPFEVYCDMEDYPGTGVTILHHDEETTTQLYYSDNRNISVTYNVTSMSQIEALINISSQCTQYIKWQCYETGFFNQGTYWVSRDGKQMTYWGGATPNHDGYCGCGEDNSCYGGYNYKCNCDYNSYTNIDAGNLIDKSVLPVTGMYFGFYSSYSYYYGYYTLGPLKCF